MALSVQYHVPILPELYLVNGGGHDGKEFVRRLMEML